MNTRNKRMIGICKRLNERNKSMNERNKSMIEWCKSMIGVNMHMRERRDESMIESSSPSRA